MAPKKKILKRIVKKARKVVPAATSAIAENDPTSATAAVEPAPTPMEIEAAPESVAVDSDSTAEKEPETSASLGSPLSVKGAEATVTVSNAGGEDAEKDGGNGCGAPAAEDEAAAAKTEGGAASGKKMVKKVIKVKKVIVRKVLRPKRHTNETAAPPDAETTADAEGEDKQGELAEKSAEAVDDAKEEMGVAPAAVGPVSWEEEVTERQKRRKTEIFIGGLDKSATEKDIREVFQKLGEIVDVRLMVDPKKGKSKGYAFLRYATSELAKKALTVFKEVEICGKLCGVSVVESTDTIHIGHIDKKWKKEDVIKLLKDAGVEKIDAVTVVPDPKNADLNRGFAFLDLETNRDAKLAYKKLQRDGAFGVYRNIKVSWATPLNEPDEEEMQKVKSVYAEGIPSAWSENKVRKYFGKFGEIERVVLSRNMQSTKRKDFAYVNYTTREAALSCIELFEKELSQTEPKVSIKVSLSKRAPTGKQNKGVSKPVSKDLSKAKPRAAQTKVKAGVPAVRNQPAKRDHVTAVTDSKASTTAELVRLLREQSSLKQGRTGCAGSSLAGSSTGDYSYASGIEKRPFSSLGDAAYYSDPKGFPRARLDTSYQPASSIPPSLASSAPYSYFERASTEYGAGAPYSSNSTASLQGRYGTSSTDDRYARY